MRDRKLTGWLPPVLRQAREYRVLLDGAGQPETDRLWASVDRLWAEQFIETSGARGLERWEGMMRLPPAGPLEERRRAIILRLRETPRFTEDTLRTVLTELCGPGRFTSVTDAERLTLTVRLARRSPMEAVGAMLARRLPANIAVDLGWHTATHRSLNNYRHGQLAGNTHEQLKEMM